MLQFWMEKSHKYGDPICNLVVQYNFSQKSAWFGIQIKGIAFSDKNRGHRNVKQEHKDHHVTGSIPKLPFNPDTTLRGG